MLNLLVEVTQKESNQLIFKDVTPPYSPSYPGGYGGVNIEAERIFACIITLDLGQNGTYEIESRYNATMEPLVINSCDFPYTPRVEVDHNCPTCPPPPCCGGDCNWDHVYPDCNQRLSRFPSGCMTLRYEVFSFNSQSGVRVSEGLTVIRIVSTFDQEQKLFALADKLTLGEPICYTFQRSEQTRLEKMRLLMLAWQKIELTKHEINVDCDCVAGRIKQVDAVLNQIQV